MKAIKARASRVRHTPGKMNKTEERYADQLRLRQMSGEVLQFWFEPGKWRLGEACFYTPDFMVMFPDGSLEFHEVKGHWEDDARVKVRAFVDKYPFVVKAVTAKRGKRGGWSEEIF